MNRVSRRLLSAFAAMLVLGAACVGNGCGSDDATGASTAGASGSAGSSGGGASTVGAGPLAPASFAALPAGWSAFDNGRSSISPRGAQTEAYATSWDFKPSSGSGPAGDLPDDGAIVDVLLLRRSGGGRAEAALCKGVPRSRTYPQVVALPLRISDMTRGRLEGSPQVAEYRLLATKGTDYRIEVRVDLAPKADRRTVQRALDAVRLPRWGRQC